MNGPAAGITSAVARFDTTVDAAFAPLRGNPVADRVMYSASEAGNFSAIWHVAGWLPFLRQPSLANLRRGAAVSIALGLESAIVNGAVKSAFKRERPGNWDNGEGRPHRLRKPVTSSFPSGHASAAMVAVALIGRRGAPLGRVMVVVAATLVSASRVHVRMHHPSDVLAGLGIGYALGRLFRRVLGARV